METDIDISSYDISSLKELVIETEASGRACKDLMDLLPQVSVVKVYSTYTYVRSSGVMTLHVSAAARQSLILESFQACWRQA